MMGMKNLSGIFICVTCILTSLFVIGCKNKGASSEGTERPYQPWVFRSVLDSQSRIITLALHDDVWAAYHTDSCAIYKVWRGRVHLQGAVYDNAHGPQPVTIGDAWITNPHKRPWKVTNNDVDVLQDVK